MVPLELYLGLTGVLNAEIIAVISARALKDNKTSEKKIFAVHYKVIILFH